MSVLLLTMGPSLSVTAIVPVAVVGFPATIAFSAVGAVGTATWVITSSSLPPEWDTALTIDDNTASLSTSEALQQGEFSVSLRVYDSNRNVISRTFTVTVVYPAASGIINLFEPWVVTPGDAADINLTELW